MPKYKVTGKTTITIFATVWAANETEARTEGLNDIMTEIGHVNYYCDASVDEVSEISVEEVKRA